MKYCKDLKVALGYDYDCCSSCHEDDEEYNYGLCHVDYKGEGYDVCCSASDAIEICKEIRP